MSSSGKLALVVTSSTYHGTDIATLDNPTTVVAAPGTNAIIVPFGSLLIAASEDTKYTPELVYECNGFTWQVNPTCSGAIPLDGASSWPSELTDIDDTVIDEPLTVTNVTGYDARTGPLGAIEINDAGTGYAANDTGTIAGGTGGTYKVLTVGALGVVTAVELTAGGTGYSGPGTGVATSTGGGQPGAGTGLKLDTELADGTGRITVVTYYQVVNVNPAT